MQTAAPSRKRRKWPFRVLWSFFAVIVGVCLFWTWSYRSALGERDRLIAELRACGEPVWWDEVADKLLAEPTENTGAELYLKAIWALGGETNPNGPRVPSKQLRDQFEKEQFHPRVHPTIEKELQLAEPALAILESAVRLPPGRVTKALRTEEPCSILLGHIQDMRQFQRILHWQSFDALAKGDANRAYHATWLALAASQQLAMEPFAISHLVRLAVMSQAIDQLTMCLCWARPPEQDLSAIDRLLAGWEIDFDLKSVAAAERGLSLTTLDSDSIFWLVTMNTRIQRKPQGFDRQLERWFLDTASSWVGRPIRLRAQVEYLNYFQHLAGSLDNPPIDGDTFIKDAEAFEKASILNRFTGETEASGIHWLVLLQKRCTINHRKITFARLALRLRRYFDQHGRLPEKLDDICDKTMPKIRLEWFQNQPITYKPTAKGFRLVVPESILPTEERKKLTDIPLSNELGVEIKFETIPFNQGAAK